VASEPLKGDSAGLFGTRLISLNFPFYLDFSAILQAPNRPITHLILIQTTMLPLTLTTLVLLRSYSFALKSSSLPEDLHAFPKYKILFLNGLPVLNATAQRWLQAGLVDEDEFLGPDKSPRTARTVVQGITGGPEDELAPASKQLPASTPPSTLERMRLGTADYLCLLLSPPEIAASPEEAQHAPQPAQTWELLQPLEGTCLYVSRTPTRPPMSDGSAVKRPQHRQGTPDLSI